MRQSKQIIMVIVFLSLCLVIRNQIQSTEQETESAKKETSAGAMVEAPILQEKNATHSPTIDEPATADRSIDSQPVPTVLTEEQVSSLVETFRHMSDHELRDKAAIIKKSIEDADFIRRANQSELTAQELQEFDVILNEESAIQVVLLERQLSRMNREYL